MEKQEMLALLQQVKQGELSPEDAVLRMKLEPFQDLGYAMVDHHRALRQGAQEVIYGAGKTPEQICGILEAMEARQATDILVTRLPEEAAAIVGAAHEMDYDPLCRLGVVKPTGRITAPGTIAVVSGGTSDMPVCEEAARTAEAMGNRVVRVYDVGVAGLHRLLAKLDILMQARVVIAVAGMEGALASVVGGLVDCPVIAVPTSVGYGANFNGLSALLSMLNSCASGVSVVNIDNGFGAGYLASMINHMGASEA